MGKLNKNVAACSLPSASPGSSFSGTVYGWGHQKATDGSTSPSLHLLDVTKKSCPAFRVVTSDQFCAPGKKLSSNFFSGDSGSPLVRGNVLTGVVSWSTNKGSFQVYTDVSQFVPSILKIIGKFKPSSSGPKPPRSSTPEPGKDSTQPKS